MLGFGPAPQPFFSNGEPGPRLQYYSSQQQSNGAPGQGEKISGRRSGKVKFFDTQKGFGFINDYRAEELGNEEVFVHYTSITAKSGFRSLAEGEEAEYEIVRGPKGFQAANVTGPAGQQVVGDSRSRNNRNAFLPMSPYAAMYPYIQQDPGSFYAGASPYTQPMMLVPQDYRSAPAAHPSAAAAAYRQHVPNPYAAVPSPYASPAPLRPFDIGKDFGGMSLGGLSIDEGVRSTKPSNPAPFGGMFGPIPSLDSSTQASSSPFTSPPATSGTAATSYKSIGGGLNSNRSNSLEGDKSNGGAVPHVSRESLIEHKSDPNVTHRPPALHSRSSSLLYASKPSALVSNQ